MALLVLNVIVQVLFTLLPLALVVGGLAILHRIGLLKNLSFSWDLIWRLFLYILLALGVIGFLTKIWSISVIIAHLPSRWLISPSRDPLIDLVSTVMLGIALYGIWRRKKWGAYLVFVRLAFTIAVQVFVYQSLSWQLIGDYTGLENISADLVGALMWLLAFALTWGHFT